MEKIVAKVRQKKLTFFTHNFPRIDYEKKKTFQLGITKHAEKLGGTGRRTDP